MEERVLISFLLDYYSVLLTDKQQEIMKMYYNEDFSLGEIAELSNTSRQAIHDVIKRCHKLLLEYEDKLKLKYKDDLLNENKNKVISKLEILKGYISDTEITTKIEEVKKDIIQSL
ncbi:putative DNA-binding protein [Candidatus Clostridium radicumherbarum]|uniref:UPF0122 protein ACJDUH_09035 n=1 Tax=Candidatus Clostridium radicumherbarum TaxID=3381662 RepID=A0ABW8TVW2_9CLOT